MTGTTMLYSLGDVYLQSGGVLHNAFLAYQTYGKLNAERTNAVLLPTFYTGDHRRNEPLFGIGRAIDPDRNFIISVNLFGNGLSSSPSNATNENAGSRFPDVSFQDNVVCQHRLLVEHLGVKSIALVAGWSMAGCQAYHWAALYPEMVRAIVPFCASAKTSVHNIVFLEGVKAALQADGDWDCGNRKRLKKPERGLRAFGRVYAGWAYSQDFFREGLYRKLGFETYEALLQSWETDHLDWDADNLLAMLRTWQIGDISKNCPGDEGFRQTLSEIETRAILVACSTDLYFTPEDNSLETRYMPNAELRVFQTPLGHYAGGPGHDSDFMAFIDVAFSDALRISG